MGIAETLGNILRRNGIALALCVNLSPERKCTTTWKEFIRAHMALRAGADFFTVEVLTLRGLVTSSVRFFIHRESRHIEVAGITSNPNEALMKQIARSVTMAKWGFMESHRYLIYDRDTRFTHSFRAIVKSS